MSAETKANEIYGKEYVQFVMAQYRDCANSREQFHIICDLLPSLNAKEVRELCDSSKRTIKDKRIALVGGRRVTPMKITSEIYEKIILCRKNGIDKRRTAEIIGCSVSTVEKYTREARNEGRL